MSEKSESEPAPEPSRRDVILNTAWRLLVSTVGTCMRHRVTGLAAEAAFFAVLSLPPLIFAMAGSIGYVFSRFDESQLNEIRQAVLTLSSRALTDETVNSIIKPTLDDVFSGGRYDVVSIGFVLALWSGSRALNVFVDTITIMYELGGQRGIVRTRMLSFALYVMGLVIGVVTIPLVLAGPDLVQRLVPERLDFVNSLYWPVVLVLCICFLATLYHASVPVRTSWKHNLPGATLTLMFWIVGSFLLRWILTTTAGESTSIYGPLAAPIAVLLWLYLLSIAVLIGAALNASFDRVWPGSETARARIELVRRLRLKAMMPRLRRDDQEQVQLEEDRAAEGAEPDDDTVALDPEADDLAAAAETSPGTSRGRRGGEVRH